MIRYGNSPIANRERLLPLFYKYKKVVLRSSKYAKKIWCVEKVHLFTVWVKIKMYNSIYFAEYMKMWLS